MSAGEPDRAPARMVRGRRPTGAHANARRVPTSLRRSRPIQPGRRVGGPRPDRVGPRRPARAAGSRPAGGRRATGSGRSRPGAGARRVADVPRLGDRLRHDAVGPGAGHAGHGLGHRQRDDSGPDDRGLRGPREVRAGRLRREQRDPARAQRVQHPGHRREPRDDPGRRCPDLGAVRLRPVQRPPGGARRGPPEDGRDRAQRQLRPLRRRRAGRRRVAVHQGPGRLPGE